MGPKILSLEQKLILLIFFVPAFLLWLAAGPGQAESVQEVEAVVIHVDQYAVYAPNLIFYFDPQMDKGKTASLAKAANQLRNRKALIFYSVTGELNRQSRALLVDIVPAGEKRGGEKPVRETHGVEQKRAGPIGKSGDGSALPADSAAERQSVGQDPKGKKPPETSAPAATITKEEITVFVRTLLELNGRKDIAAVMPFYADKVNYYDRGIVDREYVRLDLGYYYGNWDTISTSLDGDVVVIVLDPGVRVAKFVTSYSVGNSKKSLSGKVENIWKIERINGKLRLVDVKRSKAAPGPPGQ